MYSLSLLTTAATHQIYGALRSRLVDDDMSGTDRTGRDRGAVSLEQVLWFVAAGISVAVIAGILWSQIKDKADDPIKAPSAP